MTAYTRDFNSWHEFVAQVSDESVKRWGNESHVIALASSSGRRSFFNQHEWYGTSTFDEAVDMALRTGWPEGRKLMLESFALVAPRREQFDSNIYDVGGAYPVVPLYIAGDPACMATPGNVSVAANPVVRIDYTNGGLGTITSEALMLRGAAVLSLADQLEQRGYSTEIRLLVHTRGGGDTLTTKIVVKRAGEGLDIDRMSFSLAHPSVHRRLRFCLIEQMPELQRSFSGMGSTLQTKLETDPGTIYIPSASERETPQSARAAVAVAAADYLIDKDAADD